MLARSRKVEAAVKENDRTFMAIGNNYEGCPVAEFTNIGSTRFCPFIDNDRLGKAILAGHGEGDVHRDYPAKLSGEVDVDKMNPRDRTYHFIQLKTWVAGQFCKFQRDLEKNYEKCECGFKECSIYREHKKRVR